jgi:hypothetical protein
MRITNPKLPRKKTDLPPTNWWYGRPLAECLTARAQTREELTEALKTDANWLERDVGKASLVSWLKLVEPTHRGLKLDVRDPSEMEEISREVRESGVPSERLMWSLPDEAMATWGAKLRHKFPRAVLAMPIGGVGELKSPEIARMMSLAKKCGAPCTFIVSNERLTDAAVRALKTAGEVSVVGRTGKPLEEAEKELRDKGVDGFIDLVPSASLVR